MDGKFQFETSSDSFRQALRQASKDIIYTWCNAGYANKVYNETAEEKINRPVEHYDGEALLYVMKTVDIIAIPLIVLWIVFLVLRGRKRRRQKKQG